MLFQKKVRLGRNTTLESGGVGEIWNAEVGTGKERKWRVAEDHPQKTPLVGGGESPHRRHAQREEALCRRPGNGSEGHQILQSSCKGGAELRATGAWCPSAPFQ